MEHSLSIFFRFNYIHKIILKNIFDFIIYIYFTDQYYVFYNSAAAHCIGECKIIFNLKYEYIMDCGIL